MEQTFYEAWNNIKDEISFLKNITKELFKLPEFKESPWGDCCQKY